MDKDFLQIFLTERYHFYIKNNYSFMRDEYSNMYIVENEEDLTPYNGKGIKIIRRNSTNEYLSLMTQRINYLKNNLISNRTNVLERFDKLSAEFSLEMFKKYPEYKDDFFNNHKDLFMIDFYNNYENYLNVFYKDDESKKMFQFLRNLKLGVFAIKEVNVKNFRDFLINKTNNESAVDDLLVFLYKKNKTEINNYYYVEEVRDNLLKLYNHKVEKLAPFFPFFPSLEKIFVKKQVNIFEKTYKNYASISFNYTKLVLAFGIDSLSNDGMFEKVSLLLNGVAEFYSLEKHSVIKAEKNWRMVTATYNFDSELFTQEKLEKIFTDFCYFLSSSKDVGSLDENDITVWLRQHKLKEELGDIKVTQRVTKREKI